MPLPTLSPVTGESWLTVSAVLDDDTAWAAAGHEVAFGQIPITAAAPIDDAAAVSSPVVRDRQVRLGSGVFDLDTGVLVQLGDLALDGPRLDVWRAPIDNERAFARDPIEVLWREVGLDRMHHRLDSVELGDSLVVRSRVAPAATRLGFDVVYRWSSDGDALRLVVEVTPDGDWSCPLPRLGVRMRAPAQLSTVEWFGLGPGECYADSRQAVRIGRFAMSIDELQTPYVFPQENGNRAGVRWLQVTGEDGAGLRIEGAPTVDVSVRRWSSEALDRARHPNELDRVRSRMDQHRQGTTRARFCVMRPRSAARVPLAGPTHHVRDPTCLWKIVITSPHTEWPRRPCGVRGHSFPRARA